jgi:toxin ParE1/3/4
MIIEWLPAAEIYFVAIVDFIAEDNPQVAIEQGNEIETQIDGLSVHSQRGRKGRVKGTRELVIVRTPYIAAYRIIAEKLQILRILHGARQWPVTF